MHLAPALSPDGSLVAYFTEKDFYSVDLWLADGNTGKPKHRILKSGISSNYETYRFINSQANWSPDGKYLAFAAKRGARDEIVVVDAARNRPVDRIKLKLSGVTTPSWSPDGQQLVFTGYEGGLSDLFVVNRDGGGLRRLTEDKYADLHPVWSPDGKTIAFATDRGPETDFHTLAIGNFRIALYDLATGNDPGARQDGQGQERESAVGARRASIAFVSDRNGVSNIFLYDLEEHEVYQLTDFYTGAQGITPLSPVLSWAPKADRLAFVYYEDGKYDIYTITNPRSLKRRALSAAGGGQHGDAGPARPRRSTPPARCRCVRMSARRWAKAARSTAPRRASAPRARWPGPATPPRDPAGLDRGPARFGRLQPARHQRVHAEELPGQLHPGLRGAAQHRIHPGQLRPRLLRRLGDLAERHAGQSSAGLRGLRERAVNEAQILAAYADLSHRINWATGITQDPYYFLEPNAVEASDPARRAISSSPISAA